MVGALGEGFGAPESRSFVKGCSGSASGVLPWQKVQAWPSAGRGQDPGGEGGKEALSTSGLSQMRGHRGGGS